jgi:uncharacterized protein YxjI
MSNFPNSKRNFNTTIQIAFQSNQYLLKRQVLALTGKFRLYNPEGQLVLYCQQKMFKLKEDIRAYTDESMKEELLTIQARSILDFSTAYEVFDSREGRCVGILRRKGLQSMFRDEWELLGPDERLLGMMREDTVSLAMLRRFMLGSLLPQNYDILLGSSRVADVRQRFNPFRYELDLDFTMDTAQQLDRRLGIAAGILLSAIEGRQE